MSVPHDSWGSVRDHLLRRTSAWRDRARELEQQGDREGAECARQAASWSEAAACRAAVKAAVEAVRNAGGERS